MVAQYVPSAGLALGTTDPLYMLLESLIQEPSWWVSQVKGAIRQVQADLQAWSIIYQPKVSVLPDGDPLEGQASPPPKPSVGFACPWCVSTFPPRKHLGVHMARSHGVFSPARLC